MVDKKEKAQCELEDELATEEPTREELATEKPSREELEQAAKCGLQRRRKYGKDVYVMVDVALKDDAQKRKYLGELSQMLRAHGTSVRTEEKSSCIALYAKDTFTKRKNMTW